MMKKRGKEHWTLNVEKPLGVRQNNKQSLVRIGTVGLEPVLEYTRIPDSPKLRTHFLFRWTRRVESALPTKTQQKSWQT
jgi:hypothetical protein